MRVRLAIFDFYRTLYDPVTGKAMKGCRKILKYIKAKGITICIISRKEGGARKALIEEQSFSKLADKIYFISSTDKAGAYQQAVYEFRVLNPEAVVIGDYLEKDIEPAIRLGCKTIWYRKGKFAELTPELTKIYPDYQVTELEEITQII